MTHAFDRYQLRALRELGLPVLQLRTTLDAGEETASSRWAPAAHPLQPAAPGAVAQASTDALKTHLLRAARLPATAEGEAALLTVTGPIDVLRGAPAAKRALWPLLRRLRRA